MPLLVTVSRDRALTSTRSPSGRIFTLTAVIHQILPVFFVCESKLAPNFSTLNMRVRTSYIIHHGRLGCKGAFWRRTGLLSPLISVWNNSVDFTEYIREPLISK